MRLTFDILSEFYKAANTDEVRAAISGKIYIGPEPNNDQLENVSFGVLANPGNYVQDGIVNMNISAMGAGNGRPDLDSLKRICDIVVPIFDDKTIGGLPGPTLHVTIDDDKGPFKDQYTDGKFYQNIRLNFITL